VAGWKVCVKCRLWALIGPSSRFHVKIVFFVGDVANSVCAGRFHAIADFTEGFSYHVTEFYYLLYDIYVRNSTENVPVWYRNSWLARPFLHNFILLSELNL
jgi:hypothetical protein